MLLVPQRFYVLQQPRRGDKHLYAVRTRFIPVGLAAHFEVGTWTRFAGGHSGGVRTTATLDIAARMREMWRGAGT